MVNGLGTFTAYEAAQQGKQLNPNNVLQIKVNSVDDLQKLGIDPKEFGKQLMGQQMPEWFNNTAAPIGMAVESLTGLGLGIAQAVYQGKLVDAQLGYMEHVKSIQTQSLNAEIGFRGDMLKAQKDIAVLTAGTTERLAQIEAKKEVALADIASDTKKALYNSQARQQLFLSTRFNGRPAA